MLGQDIHLSKTRYSGSKVSEHSFRNTRINGGAAATDRRTASKHSDQSFRNTTIKESFEKIVINDNVTGTGTTLKKLNATHS